MSTRLFRRSALVLAFLLAACVAQPALFSGSAAASTSTRAPVFAQRPLRVALQVGHHKNNELPPQLSSLIGHTGAYGGGRSELSLNLDVADRVAKLLRAQGILVEILPATVPTGYTADAFIALHADGGSSTRSRGFKISTRWRSEIAEQDVLLVHMLTDAYRAATGLPEDGSVTRNMRGYYAYSPWRANYRVSNFTPGAIVEMGFMTNAADREVMFNQTAKVAAGITTGIVSYLRAAYGPNVGARPFGYGKVDDDIDPDAPAPRRGSSSNGPRPRVTTGDWQVVLMGKSTVSAFARAGGGGGVVAQLARGTVYKSTLRDGDYYRITLPGGREAWIHRNSLVQQM